MFMRALCSSQRLAAGNEMRIGETRLAVDQRPAVGRHHLAAGRLQDALAGRGVPFVGRAEARIDVGLALGDQAEFQRRTGLDALGDGETFVAEPDVEIAVDGMAAAGATSEAVGWRRARGDAGEGASLFAL